MSTQSALFYQRDGIQRFCRSAVFASSLLSLISPWARSPGRCPRAAGAARALRPPAFPPPPRRHSDPTRRRDTPPHRRFSEIRNPRPGLDLRQELLDLDLKNSEVDCWLGGKFDEHDEEPDQSEEDFRFNHDIPLQRSISLDRGLDIFIYLQTIGSDASSDVSSGWTISSRGNSELRLEQYRSFEDIPASPAKAKSRHISIDVTNSAYGKSVALTVLRESYAGIDEESGSVSPQIKKLQKTFSFKNFNDYKTSARNSVENLTEKDTDRVETVARTPTYRDIIFGSRDDVNVVPERNARQRRVGVTTNEWHERGDLRKDVLIKQGLVSFKSCDDLLGPKKDETAGDGASCASLKEKLRRSRSGDVLNNLRKLKRTLSEQPPDDRTVPKIVVIDADVIKESISDSDDVTHTDTSSLDVDVSCSCQICTVGDERRGTDSLLRRIFLRMVTYTDLGKSIASDEKGEIKEREMFHCIINLLKWLLGLWLRHLDHKQNNICAS